MKYFFFLIFLFINIPSDLNAQLSEVSDTITIKTKTDSQYIGILISISEDSIIMYNEEDGRLSFGRSEIKYFINGVIADSFIGTTNSSVPFYVQTAMTNGRGKHYYKNYFLFGNEFNFGATDNLNLTLGFETFSLVLDNADQLPTMNLGAKIKIATSEAAHFAISSRYYFNDEGSIFFLSLPLTFGSERTNFTISPNYFYSSNDREFALLSNLSLGLSKKTRLVIDFGSFDEGRITTILLEHLFKNGLSASVGTFYFDDQVVPNFSFSIPFGKWKNKT